ncbi:MAG: 2-phosphosulfolactate phosphatase [Bacteroidota bacterium]
MKQIDVCLSPELIHLYPLENSIVVVVDIFRATSCMVTAFAHGVGSIIPVAKVEECAQYQSMGYLAAAERDAHKIEGFDLDNSPFSYMEPYLAGKTIAMTTTNGTLAITKSKSAVKVLVGAFLNLEAISNYLKTQPYDVLIHCAGWKGKPNLEDTLFAGALVDFLKDDYIIAEDTAMMAQKLYVLKKDKLVSAVASSSHVKRLQRLGIQKDIIFCLEKNKYNVVPVLRGNALVKIEG